VTLRARAQFFIDQFRPVPSPAEVDAACQASSGDARELDAYEAHARCGLYESENELLDAGHLRAGQSIVDVGCGVGREALGFAARGLNVTAVDSSPSMVSRAERHAAGHAIRFAVMSFTSLGFDAAAFDAAYISSDVYQKTPGRAVRVTALDTLRTIVRPGGTVIFAATVTTSASSRIRWLIEEPRSLLRRWIPHRVAEPGDAFYRSSDSGTAIYHHVFHTDAEVHDEIRDAGLLPIATFGSFFVARTPGGPDRYRPAAHVSTAPVADGLLVADVGAGVSYRANRAGAALWKHFADGATAIEAARAVAADLDAPLERVERDAVALLATLVKQRLIDRADASP
jgi:SAM-dependent methyltransferase